MSGSALRNFEGFRKARYEQRGLLDGREREWFDKALSHVLRLALTLTYLDWAAVGGPEPAPIEKGFIDAAVHLVLLPFWPHARAALRQIGLSERHADARCVLKWIRRNCKTEVSREDIRRDARAKGLMRSRHKRLGCLGQGRVDQGDETRCRQGWGSPRSTLGGQPLATQVGCGTAETLAA